jgi:RNA polymerase sigma-70 factor (ECF subfamily)
MPDSTRSSRSSPPVRPDQLLAPSGVIVHDDPDHELVERFRHGDRDAFTELVIRYQRPIYNAAFWILRSAEDASDIAQTVFLKVAERLDEFDSQHRFFSWIYRIAINESLNLQRTRGRDEALEDEDELPDARDNDPESQASDAEVAKRIRAALLAMSTNDRVVLTLRHFSECSYQEIAQILDIDETTVKSRLFEARHRLGHMLRDLK